MWEIGDKMAQAAAMMTDTRSPAPLLGSAWPGHFNKTIAEVMRAKHRESRAAAVVRGRSGAGSRAAARAKGTRGRSGDDAAPFRGREVIPDEEKRGGGSDDIGDISWNVPTVTLRFRPTWRPVPATTGPTPFRWRRRSRTKASRSAPRWWR